MTRVVGLTGGIACGKSTVSTQLIAEGIPVVDCDVLARKVVEPGRPALRKLVEIFGEDILLSDGGLDRKKLGEIVFKDEEKRNQLNAVVGPAIFSEITKGIVWNWCLGTPVVVIDAPTLFESGHLVNLCAEIIVVAASEETQILRVINRDKLSREQALDRIKAQIPVQEKVKRASVVLFNDGARKEFNSATQKVVEDLKAKYTYSFSILWSAPGVVAIVAVIFAAIKIQRA